MMELGFEYIGRPGPKCLLQPLHFALLFTQCPPSPDNSNHDIINGHDISNSGQDISWRDTGFDDILPELHFPPLNIPNFVIDYSEGHWKKQPNETGSCVTMGFYSDSHYSGPLSPLRRNPSPPKEAAAPTEASALPSGKHVWFQSGRAVSSAHSWPNPNFVLFPIFPLLWLNHKIIFVVYVVWIYKTYISKQIKVANIHFYYINFLK